jgi:hypothetical protein
MSAQPDGSETAIKTQPPEETQCLPFSATYDYQTFSQVKALHRNIYLTY